MGWYQKFCEWGTDAKFVPHSKKCDLCGKKVGFLNTGFWSINAKRLADGVICDRCYKKLDLLSNFRTKWIPNALRKEPPFSALTGGDWQNVSVQDANTVLEAPQKLGKEELAAIGAAYTSIFRMRDACFIQPTALQTGVVRAKKLSNKLVLFGFVQLGEFKKGDSVLILDVKEKREATVLEAYIYDPEVPANDLDVMLKANTGKQCLVQWQQGWLILDNEEKVGRSTTVIA
jgi:hypothetical protein